MKHTMLHRGRPLLAAACGAALLALAPAAQSADDAANRAELEKQLQSARKELDEAAREVADLSRQLYGGESGQAMRWVQAEPRSGSMLGVNISGAAARDEGVEVMGVSPGGPAEQAGLKAGDVVVAVDGKALRRSGQQGAGEQLIEQMRGIEPGSKVKVDYLRDGQRRSVSLTTAPAEPPVVRIIRERLGGPLTDGIMIPGMEGLLGPERAFRSLELVPITPKLGAYFGAERGLLVVRVPESKGLPLEEGDVLLDIDGRQPENPGHAFRILRSYQPGEKVKLRVLRQRKQLTLEATMPAADEAADGVRRMRMIMPAPGAPHAPPAPPAPKPPGAA